MKVQQIFMIDINLKEKLQDVPNKSSLVNGLLEKYFNVLPSEISSEELIDREQALKDQLRQLEEKKKLSDDIIAQRDKLKAEADARKSEDYEKQQERLKIKAELRRKYAMETPRNKQSAEDFEQFLLANGYHGD